MILAALWTGVAVGQNAPNGATPTETTAGPSSSVARTEQTIDGRGVETNTKETYDKSQAKVCVSPTVVAKSTTTTTTDETSH